MTLEDALRAELITIDNLYEKVFPLNAPKGVKTPYLFYVSSEGRNSKDLNGFLDDITVSVEFNIVHDNYDDMKTLARAVTNKLKTFEGRQIGGTGPHIQEIVFEDDSPEIYEAQADKYRKVISAKLYF